jgi:PRTRC genetic system protein A
VNAILSPLDTAIQTACPIIPAPHQGALPEFMGYGKRLIATASGIVLESRSPALHIRLRVETFNAPLPYGEVDEFIRPAHGPIPARLFHEFLELAIAARPSETAAVIVATPSGYALDQPQITSATGGSVSYIDELDDDRIVVDIHSHGMGRAFFSGTDDASDLSRRGPYLAVVAGYAAKREEIPLVLRAVSAPYLIELEFADLAMRGVIT